MVHYVGRFFFPIVGFFGYQNAHANKTSLALVTSICHIATPYEDCCQNSLFLDGVLSIQHVIAELQRLILRGWVWNVEAVGNNSFCMVFPSGSELLRMVEWG
jgi:hypothetical protein